MSTFFLESATATTSQNVSEEVLDTRILVFENAMLEAELAYQNFMQEAILTEATILMEEEDAPAGESRWSKTKEAVTNFFKSIGAWFGKMKNNIKAFIGKILKPIKDKMIANKKKAREAKGLAPDQVLVKYQPSVIFKTMKAYNSFFSKGLDVDSAKLEEGLAKLNEFAKEALPDKKEAIKIRVADAEKGIAESEKLVEGIVKVAEAIVKESAQGEKAAKDAERTSTTATDEKKVSLLQRIKESLSTKRKKIAAWSKTMGPAMSLAKKVSNNYSSAVAKYKKLEA